MKWKFANFFWMKYGNCWRLLQLPAICHYYSGNQIWFCWWRIALVFERTKWIDGGAQ